MFWVMCDSVLCSSFLLVYSEQSWAAIHLHQLSLHMERSSALLQTVSHWPGQREEPGREQSDHGADSRAGIRIHRPVQRRLRLVWWQHVVLQKLGFSSARYSWKMRCIDGQKIVENGALRKTETIFLLSAWVSNTMCAEWAILIIISSSMYNVINVMCLDLISDHD